MREASLARCWLLIAVAFIVLRLAIAAGVNDGDATNPPSSPSAKPVAGDGAGPSREEEVHFDSDGHTLAGVLVLPTTPGPHPAVVFIHGSGPSIGMTGHCTPGCASSSPGRELLRYVGINRALERPAATGRGRVFAIGRRKRLTP